MIDILIHTDSRYRVSRKVIRKAVLAIFAKNKLQNMDAEVSIAVVGQRKMREVAAKFMGDKTDHEILSFPFEDVSDSRGFVNFPDGKIRLGDIVLCWPRLVEAASRDNVLVDDETIFLVSHGVEHLLGKHHE